MAAFACRVSGARLPFVTEQMCYLSWQANYFFHKLSPHPNPWNGTCSNLINFFCCFIIRREKNWITSNSEIPWFSSYYRSRIMQSFPLVNAIIFISKFKWVSYRDILFRFTNKIGVLNSLIILRCLPVVFWPRANWFRNRAITWAFKNLREGRAQLALVEFAHFQCASHPYGKFPS